MVGVAHHFSCAMLAAAVISLPAAGQALSPDVEAVRVANVGAAWETVDLVNTYSTAIVTCTYNLRSASDNEATVRIQSVTANSFQVRAQRFENSNAVTASDVHCLIADEGLNTLSDGRVIEARSVVSTVTAGNSVGWNIANYTEVTSQVTGGHASLVVLGQVMSFNDVQASVFTTNNCNNRSAPPTPARMCVAKHIGQINDTRLDETLGFIITEPGTGSVNDVTYAFARGADTVRGVGNAPPYTYGLGGDFDTGVATLAAEDGGQGGWAVLFGVDPLPNNQIQLAVDEETIAGDTSRSHTTEEVYYGVFQNNQTAALDANKSISVSPVSSIPFAVPGSDVLYTLTVENAGTAPIDTDTVFLVDTLANEVSFYNGDIDDSGPETGVIAFNAMSSGLTFSEAGDLGFSSAATKPTQMSECTYTPAAGYDANVRHVCFAPKGRMRAGSIQPDAEFSLTFRGRIE